MNDAHVEEDFRGVGDGLELSQRLVELIVVVPPQGGYPGFYFLRDKPSQRRPRICATYTEQLRYTPEDDEITGRGFIEYLPV